MYYLCKAPRSMWIEVVEECFTPSLIRLFVKMYQFVRLDSIFFIGPSIGVTMFLFHVPVPWNCNTVITTTFLPMFFYRSHQRK